MKFEVTQDTVSWEKGTDETTRNWSNSLNMKQVLHFFQTVGSKEKLEYSGSHWYDKGFYYTHSRTKGYPAEVRWTVTGSKMQCKTLHKKLQEVGAISFDWAIL